MQRELWLIDSERQLVRLAENGSRENFGVTLGSRESDKLESILRERSRDLSSVGILLDSTCCFWEAISSVGKSTGETKFELEEKTPFDAEDVHFVMDPEHFPGFVVATELAPCHALAEALQRNDVEVEFIVPLALAHWQWARPSWSAADSVFICQSDSRYDILLQRAGKLVAWSLAWDNTQLLQRCRAASAETMAIGASVESEVGEELQREFGTQVTLIAGTYESLYKAWLAKRGGWLGNLAVGQLESRKVREGLAKAIQLVSLMVLLTVVTLAGSTYYQAVADGEAATELRNGQQRRLLKLHPELPRRRTEEWFATEIAAKKAVLDAVRSVVDRPSLLATELPLALQATGALAVSQGPVTRVEVRPDRVLITGEFTEVRPAENVFIAAGWDVSPQPLSSVAKTITIEAQRTPERQDIAGRRLVGAKP